MKQIEIAIIGIIILGSCQRDNKRERINEMVDSRFIVIKADADTIVKGQMYRLKVWLDKSGKDQYTFIGCKYNGVDMPLLRPNDTLNLEFTTDCKEGEVGLNKRAYTITALLKSMENDSIWVSQDKNYFTDCK